MGRKLSYGMAINEALHQMMGADERVFILGEDVAKMGGKRRDRLRNVPASGMS